MPKNDHLSTLVADRMRGLQGKIRQAKRDAAKAGKVLADDEVPQMPEPTDSDSHWRPVYDEAAPLKVPLAEHLRPVKGDNAPPPAVVRRGPVVTPPPPARKRKDRDLGPSKRLAEKLTQEKVKGDHAADKPVPKPKAKSKK